MMYLSLNCPRCRKRLVYVPLDGLTLYFCCEEHGAVILRPLVPADDDVTVTTRRGQQCLQSSDAA